MCLQWLWRNVSKRNAPNDDIQEPLYTPPTISECENIDNEFINKIITRVVSETLFGE